MRVLTIVCAGIGWASFLTCWAITGQRMTLCALAYRRQRRSRFWRAWVVVFDRLMRRRHPAGHCRFEHFAYGGEEWTSPGQRDH